MVLDTGIYEDRKGGLYELLAIARNSNDCKQQMVVYKSLQNSDFPKGTIWIKTKTEFTTPGRFKKI